MLEPCGSATSRGNSMMIVHKTIQTKCPLEELYFHCEDEARFVWNNRIPDPMLAEAIGLLRKIEDSRTDPVGNTNKPQSLVETFWLDQARAIIARWEARG